MEILKKAGIVVGIAMVLPYVLLGAMLLMYIKMAYSDLFVTIALVGLLAGVLVYKHRGRKTEKNPAPEETAPEAISVKPISDMRFRVAQINAAVGRDMEYLFPGSLWWYTCDLKTQVLCDSKKIEINVQGFSEGNIHVFLKDGQYDRIAVKKPVKRTRKPAKTENQEKPDDLTLFSPEYDENLRPDYNFGLIASVYVQDNYQLFESLCQEAVDQGRTEFIITPDLLTEEPEAWCAICEILKTDSYGFPTAEVFEGGGIIVGVPQYEDEKAA